MRNIDSEYETCGHLCFNLFYYRIVTKGSLSAAAQPKHEKDDLRPSNSEVRNM